MAANRCLSDLPDDLLRHVLSFAPAKEGASTAVLSRRWRSLWRTSGAVNLDSRSYGSTTEARDRFLRGVQAALDAERSTSTIRRLTVRVELEAETYVEVLQKHLSLTASSVGLDDGLIQAVLSHRAARRAEVIHIEPTSTKWTPFGFYTLSYGAVPSEFLRVLHVTNCWRFMPAPPGTAFPRLAELRLRRCHVSIQGLQALINVAPQLVTLNLERVPLYYSDEEEEGIPTPSNNNGSPSPVLGVLTYYRLCCPSVTTLVWKDSVLPFKGIELNVPRLQYLRFKGCVRSPRLLSLKSQLTGLAGVDLHLTDDDDIRDPFVNEVRVPFWQFLGNFKEAKVVKLKLDYPIHQVADKDQLLRLSNVTFRNLSRLELQGSYDEPSGRVAAVAIANLLHSCPALSDFRLKLLTKASRHFRLTAGWRPQLEFDESVERFKSCPTSLSGGDDDDDHDDEVSDIPSLSDSSFKCMQDCLSRVTLQFSQMETPNCFGTQLVKFFAQNAMVLQELYVHDGKQRIRQHMNLVKIGRWSANSPKRRNGPLTARGLTVLPLQT